MNNWRNEHSGQREKHAWPVQGTTMRPAWLEWRELGREVRDEESRFEGLLGQGKYLRHFSSEIVLS